MTARVRRSDRPEPGGERYEDLLQRLGDALVDLVPGEAWRRIELLSSMAGSIQDLWLTVIMKDGSRPDVVPPMEVSRILVRLREVLYEPGRGTWFSARVSIDPPDRVHFDYNKDFEPVLMPPISAAHYAEELQMFPRDPEHIPEWLSAKLAAADEQQN